MILFVLLCLHVLHSFKKLNFFINENEKEAAKLKDIGEIRKWCIEALLEDDTEAQDVLRAVAQDKLGMMKKKGWKLQK